MDLAVQQATKQQISEFDIDKHFVLKLDLDFIAANSALISYAFMLEAKAHHIPI